MSEFRIEKDSIGEVEVPSDVLWGAATQRALNNFPISERTLPFVFTQNLALVKKLAAETNCDLGLLDKEIADAISLSVNEILEGNHFDQFPLDVFQTGSGTSTNMNMNEVIANLANKRLGGKIGSWKPCHPNDHVNLGQSSNDVMPSVLHIAAAISIQDNLIPSLECLFKSLSKKAISFKDIGKIGRTHLMDAVPMTLGQEFSGWTAQIERSLIAIRDAMVHLNDLALGGTAIGTGVGAHKKFATSLCKRLRKVTNIDFKPAENSFEAISWRGPSVLVSGAIKTAATAIFRIADDIRLLASGPRIGLAEIVIPTLQPGSSIMPGKVNPVIPEMACQVANQIIGNDSAITAATVSGHLELNTQLPLIADNLLESIDILANATSTFADKCIEGIRANEERCKQNIEMSLAMATALVPKIGYAKASEIAKKAYASERSVRDVAYEMEILPDEELNVLLSIDNFLK